MSRKFTKRIHESVALSAILAAAVSLNVAWIDNLLVSRSEYFYNLITLNPELGPISGIYLDNLGAFFVTFFIALAILRSKDCSPYRERVFWFFILSIVLFLLLTLPFVYEFRVS